ncbi:MAG: diacylglycerol kinase family protein [Myxococcota bacterium]|nr:diacylglycerol kinase family protein [Myxococcota bacterium]
MADWRNKLPSVHDYRTTARARNENERIVCVLNPKAAAGRAGDRIAELRRAVQRAFVHGEVVVSQHAGHATELARQAVLDGADIVAAVGGDGTCNEVVNGFFKEGKALRRDAIFSIIPWGTGSDLSKSLRAPSSLEDALWVASTGMTLPTDAALARFQTEQGPTERVFLNVAGFGANGDVVDRANSSSKRFGGRVTFLQATVSSILGYSAQPVALSWEGPDGNGSWEGELFSAFLANAQYCGGGMNMGRGGSMHDGVLDLTIIPELGTARLVKNTWRLYDGSAHEIGGVRRIRARSLTARALSGSRVLIDLDGEQPGWLDAEFRVLEKQLQVRGGWLRSPLLERNRERWDGRGFTRT